MERVKEKAFVSYFLDRLLGHSWASQPKGATI